MEKSVRFVANGAETIEQARPLLSDSTSSEVETVLDEAFASTKTKNPNAFSYLLTFPVKKSGTLNISVYQKNWNKYDRILESYDRFTGKLLRTTPFGALHGGDQIYQLNFDLHTGSVLGLPGKILAFFASLIAASLPVSGFLIWWGKRKKGRGKRTLLTKTVCSQCRNCQDGNPYCRRYRRRL